MIIKLKEKLYRSDREYNMLKFRDMKVERGIAKRHKKNFSLEKKEQIIKKTYFERRSNSLAAV